MFVNDFFDRPEALGSGYTFFVPFAAVRNVFQP